jgi:hypothetical protein
LIYPSTPLTEDQLPNSLGRFTSLNLEQLHPTSLANSQSTDTMTSSLPKPSKKIELFSGNYFAACTIGGIIGK